MKVPRHRIAEVFAERVGSATSKELARELAAYLLDEGRTGELDSIMRDIMQQRAEHGIVEAAAISAHPLDSKVRSDIEAQVREIYPSAKIVIIDEVIDRGVVGGVKIALANEQLDLSIRAKLNKFKQLTVA